MIARPCARHSQKVAMSFYSEKFSYNNMKCSIIKIEESYGGPAEKDSGCEFDPIVALLPPMHC